MSSKRTSEPAGSTHLEASSVSGGMQVLAMDGSAILDYDAITRALLTIYGRDEVSDVITSPAPLPKSSIQVKPHDEPPFSVRLDKNRASCGMDGLPPQNTRVAVALRAEIPRDATRIVAVDLMHVENFAELPWGITVEQLNASWRPLEELE